jgi:hypothetical protein
MIEDYLKIVENSVEVCKEEFNKDNLLNSSFIMKGKFYLDKEMFNKDDIICFNFIYEDSFYVFLCLDNKEYFSHPNYEDFGDLLDTPFYIKEYDDVYIKKCENFKVLKLNTCIIYESIESGDVCDYEMQYLVPMLRRYKIKKLLNS